MGQSRWLNNNEKVELGNKEGRVTGCAVPIGKTVRGESTANRVIAGGGGDDGACKAAGVEGR